MRITGIIAEYNPFHNGHLYQIETLRSRFASDYIIVLMNGNFTQRGDVALIDKYSRATMALQAGADLILELPVLYGTGSAEFFASGAIRILHALGCVDSLCFGCETNDLDLLRQIAEIYAEEPPVYRTELNQALRTGLSFPKARVSALRAYGISTHRKFPDDLSFLKMPNTILAIEYLKAISKQNCSIEPILIPRTDSSYHSTDLTPSASATAIRSAYETNGLSADFAHTVPSYVYNTLMQAYHVSAPMTTADFYSDLQYCLWKPRRPLTEYLDISDDLAHRIQTKYHPEYTYAQFLDSIACKQYTMTRMKRCLLHILLDIKTDDMQIQSLPGTDIYARVLGFRKSSKDLLRHIRTSASLPIIQSVADAEKMMIKNHLPAKRILELDIDSSHLYEQVRCRKFHHVPNNEYTHEVVIIP